MATKSAETKQFWRKQIKKRAIEAFGNKCFICKNSYPTSVYDFHHINPSEKEIGFGGNISSSKIGWLRIRDELLKCVLVCSNCHRIIHNEENNINIEKIIHFNMDYYEWPEIEYQINHITGEKISNFTKEDYFCHFCGQKKSKPNASCCKECADKRQQITERPSREELKDLIRNQSFLALGKQFGVSDNAIRKWCVSMSLPKSKRKIDSYSNEEWKNI